MTMTLSDGDVENGLGPLTSLCSHEDVESDCTSTRINSICEAVGRPKVTRDSERHSTSKPLSFVPGYYDIYEWVYGPPNDFIIHFGYEVVGLFLIFITSIGLPARNVKAYSKNAESASIQRILRL